MDITRGSHDPVSAIHFLVHPVVPSKARRFTKTTCGADLVPNVVRCPAAAAATDVRLLVVSAFCRCALSHCVSLFFLLDEILAVNEQDRIPAKYDRAEGLDLERVRIRRNRVVDVQVQVLVEPPKYPVHA